jgi:hypothetical protein
MTGEISRRQARKRLVRKEQLQEGKSRTYEAALRWYNATQALGAPGLGDGQPALGEIVENILAVVEGQKNMVRWHNGTLTVTWFPGAPHPMGTWIVAATRWNDMSVGPWLEERIMRVEQLVDVISAKVRTLGNDYWRFSGELDDLELADHLMIAPVANQADAPVVGEHGETTDEENSRWIP